MSQRPYYSEFHKATARIQTAYELALRLHGRQLYGDRPYSVHLEAVARGLEQFGFTPRAAASDRLVEDIVCAGWLHDAVEDTGVTASEIERQLGHDVADTVHRVTDEPGDSRDERKARTYPKIRGHFAATVVKLADRIANVEASLADDEKQFQKYAVEQQKLTEGIYFPLIAEAMWARLRLLTARSFGEIARPPTTSVQLFHRERPDVEIDVSARLSGGALQVEDFACGERIKGVNDGDSDYERILTIDAATKDSLLLALLRERFHGNSAFSELQAWLAANAIVYKSWSG